MYCIVQNINREVEQISFDIEDLERWRDRIFTAIHQGFIFNVRMIIVCSFYIPSKSMDFLADNDVYFMRLWTLFIVERSLRFPNLRVVFDRKLELVDI